MDGVPYGIRTRVAAVRGRCPRPLDEGDMVAFLREIFSNSKYYHKRYKKIAK